MTTQLTPAQEHADALVAMIRELLPFVGYAATCEDMKKHAYELLALVDPDGKIKASDSREVVADKDNGVFLNQLYPAKYVLRLTIDGVNFYYSDKVADKCVREIDQASRMTRPEITEVMQTYLQEKGLPAGYELQAETIDGSPL